MPSVIPIVASALLLTGTTGALWRLGNALFGRRSEPAQADLRMQALGQLAWSLFLLLHSIFLLLVSESREVSDLLSICASVGGGLAFLASFVSLAKSIALERRIPRG